ncbi:MAG: patatin family protein [Ruminococcus sp.]|nr:patatin family protein [Ruminococcus sp.]
MKKTGLVMEGGAMRGMFTAGVIDVMMENNIRYDGAIGVSAGAVFGCNYKSGQIGRAIRYNKRFCGDKRYSSFQSFLTTGDLYGADFCYNELPFKLDIWDFKAFEENPMEFYVTCTDVVTGKPVYHKCSDGLHNDIQWMRASASVPLVSRIVEIGENKLLDGGISDSVPIKHFEKLGYNRNVVILTQPLDYIKKKNSLMWLIKLKLGNYPEMVKAMANRHIMYNETTKYIREKELSGELFVIRPPQALNIGSVEKNPDELERVYQIGRKTAENCLEQLKVFLAGE